eukprot:Gb_12368 [translate_table: standard]
MVPQLIWKRLITSEAISFPYSAMAISILPGIFLQRFVIKTANFSSQVTPDKGIVTEFLLNKCGLTQESIAAAFRHCNRLLNAQSTQNSEEVLELLRDCGLTLAQIRTVVICNPHLMFLSAENNIKPKVSFLNTFMKGKDIAKLISNNARIFNMNLERRLKASISVLHECGFQGEALSKLLAKQPRFLTTPTEKIIESFEQAEKLGFSKGSKMFDIAFDVIIATGKDKVDQKVEHLKSLGFSDQELLLLCRRRPAVLSLSEEKVKRNVDFLVESIGLPLGIIAKTPFLLSCSLEKRLIPRYRVAEALKLMPVLKKRSSFPRIVLLTEEKFLKTFVDSYPEFSVLRDIYKGVDP